MYWPKFLILIPAIALSLNPNYTMAQSNSYNSSVKKLIEGIEKYHYKDAVKFSSLFLKDCTLITSSGVAINGRDNLERAFTNSYKSIYSGEISISIDDIKSSGDIAVVRGLIFEKLKPAKTDQPLHHQYFFSLLANKTEAGWKVKWMMGVQKREE